MATPMKSGTKSPGRASVKTKPAAASAGKTTRAAKPAAKTLAARASAPAKKPAAKAVKASSAGRVTADQRRCYVEVAAYYIAERRGFDGGSELADWAQAEAEIDRLLREGILNQ